MLPFAILATWKGVKIASTPGSFSASDVSICLMRPLPIVLVIRNP